MNIDNFAQMAYLRKGPVRTEIYRGRAVRYRGDRHEPYFCHS